MTELSSLPMPVLGGLGVLVVIEFGLMIWAVLDWAKRPAELVRGNRILWLLIIAFVNIIGPIIYLTVARLPEPIEDAGVLGSPEAARSATDALYGPTDESIIS